MVHKREYNLRPRLNRLAPAIPCPSTTLVRTSPTLSNLATDALDRLRHDPRREQDALGQRDELIHLASVAPAPAPALAPTPTVFDTYLVRPVAADPLVDFPASPLPSPRSSPSRPPGVGPLDTGVRDDTHLLVPSSRSTRSHQLVSHNGYLLAYRSWGPPPATSEALNRFVARWNEAERMTEEFHLAATHKLAPALAEALVDDPDLDILRA
ncbi:hypothetical protein JCM3775_001418 [Rhodotorula graminis]